MVAIFSILKIRKLSLRESEVIKWKKVYWEKGCQQYVLVCFQNLFISPVTQCLRDVTEGQGDSEMKRLGDTVNTFCLFGWFL